MANIYMLLLMSVSGTVMYILSCIFSKRLTHYLWQYAMLVTSLIMLLLPIQKIFEIPKLFKVSVPQNIGIVSADTAYTPVLTENIIIGIWLFVAVLFAVRIVYRYIKSTLALKQITEICDRENVLFAYTKMCKMLSVKKNISIYTSKHLNSPLLFGLLRPQIIIPDRDFSQNELEMILAHELTHYKHRDLWISLLASVAQCVHWFNPAVYLIGKSITEVRELFCDETVLKYLNAEDKKAYGTLILSVIERELNKRLVYTTSMATGSNIKKRLKKIVEFKMPTKASTVAGIMAVFACVVSALTAFGFETVSEVIPEEIKQIIPVSLATPTPQTPQITPYPEETATTYQSTENGGYEVYSEQPVMVQADISDTTPTEKPQPTREASRHKIDSVTTVDITKGSVSFGASFNEKGQSVESAHTFTANTDATMAVYSSTGNISVVDADTDEVIYSGNTSDDKTARISVKGGQRLSVSVTSTVEGESKADVYAYGYVDSKAEK